VQPFLFSIYDFIFSKFEQQLKSQLDLSFDC